MKKWMTLLLCCVLALNLTACGAGAPGGPEDNAPPQASALHFEVATQVYENEYKADDGTVLLRSATNCRCSSCARRTASSTRWRRT